MVLQSSMSLKKRVFFQELDRTLSRSPPLSRNWRSGSPSIPNIKIWKNEVEKTVKTWPPHKVESKQAKLAISPQSFATSVEKDPAARPYRGSESSLGSSSKICRCVAAPAVRRFAIVFEDMPWRPTRAERHRSVSLRRRGKGGRVYAGGRCVHLEGKSEWARRGEGVAQPQAGQLIARYVSDTQVCESSFLRL